MFYFAFIPLLAVIFCHSVIYNSWRHLYFIYFPLIYLAVLGLSTLKKISKRLKIILIFLSCTFITTIFWMIKNHPYEMVYYNPLVRNEVVKSFERDYWGLSVQPFFEEVLRLEKNNKEKIKIWNNDPLNKFVNYLTPIKNRERFLFTDQELAKYAVINFYNWNYTGLVEKKYYDALNKKFVDFSQWQIIDQIEVDHYPLAILLKNLESTDEAGLLF